MFDIIRPWVNYTVMALTILTILGLLALFIRPVLRYLRDVGSGLVHGWSRFWFTPADPTTLGAIRLCTGAVLFYVHVCCLAHVLSFIGPQGWIDAQAAEKIRALKGRIPFDTYHRQMPGGESLVVYERRSLLDGVTTLQRIEQTGELRNRLAEKEQDELTAHRISLQRLAWKEGLDRFERSQLAELRRQIGALVSRVNDPTINERWADADQTLGVLAAKRPDAWTEWTSGLVGHSLWFEVQNPDAVLALYSIFLVSCFFFMIGLFSRITSVIVWVGHLSYIWRGYNTWFGMDTIILMLTFYMMFGPSGAALSVDRLIRRFRAARQRLRFAAGDLGPQPSWTANAVVRMIQIHMSIVYLAAGCAKLQGQTWWNGSAIWITMVTTEFAVFDMTWLARVGGDWAWQLVSASGVIFTIFFEIGFIFLIWLPRARPLMLTLAVLLHAGIGLFMGLGGFGAIMLTGCLSFVSPQAVRGFFERLFKGQGGFQFVVNPSNRQQLSAAQWIQTADVWQQVELLRSERGGEVPPGTLIAPNGERLSGLQAFRRLFRSLRVLWLIWPAAFWAFRGLRAETRSGHWQPHSSPTLNPAAIRGPAP